MAWCATSSCRGFECRGCLEIFCFWWIEWCYPLTLLLMPNGVLQSQLLVVGRCRIWISEHLGCPYCVRIASCARDGRHSWSCTHILGGNSNIKGGCRLFVELACLMSIPLVPWTAGVRIPVQLVDVVVAQEFAPPLVMWRYGLPLLDMVLSRSCGAGLRSGVAIWWLAGCVRNLRAW